MNSRVEVTIALTNDEALVLFEWLAGKAEGLPTEHRAEQIALWGIEAQLEKSLVEPLRPDYAALVTAARERLAATHEE
jgi:hypothetical protein